MKISNSKKQLARTIYGNGGWRGGAPFAAQSGLLGYVEFYASKPVRESVYWRAKEGVAYRFLSHTLLPNWHQTILSRDEYFHLYPVAKSAPELAAEAKPAIEHLAADYRNRKDYADRKQQEADAAKADAEAKLAELVAAGKALGLLLSVAAPEQKYTGKFYANSAGARNHQTICDGCGKRYGLHYGERCERGDQENA